MAQYCAICEKGYNAAWTRLKLRGKYNPTVKHQQKPNLQWVRLPLNWKAKGVPAGTPRVSLAGGQRAKVCTKCRKALARA